MSCVAIVRLSLKRKKYISSLSFTVGKPLILNFAKYMQNITSKFKN